MIVTSQAVFTSTMSITASSAALAKLEPFLLLAKNVRGSAAAKLIEEATAAPGCYVFCELLECEGIAEVSTIVHSLD